MRPIEKALKHFDNNQAAMARALAVSPSFVSQWLSDSRPVPAKHCIRLEGLTGGSVTAHELRPDIFPRKAA